MTELHELDATAQSELVASGQATPRELVDHAIGRIEARNPELNAVIWSDFDTARAAADRSLGRDNDASPFPGVPFLIKDIGATQAGLPHWLGNQALKRADHRSAADTELGSRFRDAGLITLGKTNLPEVGSSPTTQPLSCGPTNNPWDLSRSPAGSSGGSAAAVAAGMVSIAHANDGGGSTRLPAAWCGLVGLKATRGLVPYPENIARSTSELAVTKSVRDTARLLDAVWGATDADLYRAAAPAESYSSVLGRVERPLRVAMLTEGGRWDVDPACVAGVEVAARLLADLGHHVEPVDSHVLLGEASLVNGRLWQAGIARRIDALGEALGRPLTEDEVDPYNWTAAERGRSMLATDYAAAMEAQQLWSVSVIEWSSAWDLLLTPTAGTPPLTTEELWPPQGSPWKIGAVYGRVGAFTLPFNVTGQPAISLPLHQTDQGLPVGIQLVAAMNRDDLLLSVAADLELAAPWSDRYPY